MARLPIWLKCVAVEEKDGELWWTLKCRYWHPGYWIARWKMYRLRRKWLTLSVGPAELPKVLD